LAGAYADNADEPRQLRVLFVHGGHDFDKLAMYAMLDSFADIDYDRIAMPAALDLFRPGLEKQYDVIVTYDYFVFPHTDEQLERFQALMKTGIGLVVLHHSLCGYSDWYEYHRMIGGRFVRNDGTVIEGVARPRSTWRYGETLNITVVDPTHPIVQGIDNFTVVDEAYGNIYVNPDVHVLLTTDNPHSTKEVAWTWNYGNSRVFVTLLGHDDRVFSDPNYRRLIQQAIRWAGDSP